MIISGANICGEEAWPSFLDIIYKRLEDVLFCIELLLP